MQGGGSRKKWQTLGLWCGGVIIVILAVGAVLVATHWPFSRDKVIQDLQGRLKGRLVIGAFRESWFPPGYTATDIKVVPLDAGGGDALMSARSMVLRSSYHGLLTHTVLKVKVVGLRLNMPAGGHDALFATGIKSSIKDIGELQIEDSEWVSTKLRFRAKEIVLRNVGPERKVHFRASLITDKPQGDLEGEGEAGPWKSEARDQTPISGTFRYSGADLAAFEGLHGILTGKGNFKGTFTTIGVSGTLNVPDFRIDGSAHAVNFNARYDSDVDARNGDVTLTSVEANVARTTILAKGNIEGGKGAPGKTARVELAVNRGRVEDLLNYFSEEKKASMTGAVQLHAFAEVPPGPDFLKKLKLTGDFGVGPGKFTSPSTQRPINTLASTAEDKAAHRKESDDEEASRTAISNLRGHVVARDGLARLSGISFEFPGAVANMDGTFQLISKQVDIHGTLRTTGSLPDTTSGVKELMLKIATPFMKKKNTTVAPFAITGSSSNPSVHLDLTHKQKY